MHEFHIRLESNGRIVLPADCRRQLHFKPGEELILRIDDDELRLYSLKHSLRKAQALVRQKVKSKNFVDDFIASRREEADRE